MTKKSTALFFSIFLFGCKEQTNLSQPVKYVQTNPKTIGDSLDNYFYKYEIEPQIIINNIDEKQKKISFLNHNIEWIDSESETKVRIDKNLISLIKEVTLNNVWGDNEDSVDFANNWDQIKYFKFDDKEIIGIRMSFYPCTELGCSVDYFLLYDVHNKTKN